MNRIKRHSSKKKHDPLDPDRIIEEVANGDDEMSELEDARGMSGRRRDYSSVQGRVDIMKADIIVPYTLTGEKSKRD